MAQADRLSAANKARRQRQNLKGLVHGQRRGNSPVRRKSQHAGEHELREWRRNNLFSARERNARMKAISQWNYGAKEKGQCWGPLGPSGERFLDSLMGLRCFRTGRLDLAIKTIATKLRMCVQTVVSYVERLEGLGLLARLRRTRPIDDPEPGGPLVEQITNAYWFLLPRVIAERVLQILDAGGKPADQAQREADEATALAQMLETLSAEELARFHAGDEGVLAKALASLGRVVDRERF